MQVAFTALLPGPLPSIPMSGIRSIEDRAMVETEPGTPSSASVQQIFSSTSAFTKYQVM